MLTSPINFFKIPGILLWEKDIKSTYLWGNEESARLFGFQRPQDMIGSNDYDMPCKCSELASVFQECDQRVILNKKPYKFLEVIQCRDDKWKIFIVTKIPKFNQDGIIAGTIGHSVEVTTLFNKFGHFLLNTRGGKNKDFFLQSVVKERYQAIKLSPRQSECLFFLLRHCSSKEIANLLKLKPKTIDGYANKIKNKFNCHTRAELFDKAIEYGFLNMFPEIIFNQQFSIPIQLEGSETSDI